jgi:hypothetical protein
MTTNLELASKLARRTEIESVRLKSVEYVLHDSEIGGGIDAEITAGAQYTIGANDTITVAVTTTLSAKRKDGEAMASVEAVYLVTYIIEDLGSASELELEHFANLNGIFNTWPYWRELVQGLLARSEITRAVLPVFKPPVFEVDVGEVGESPS